MILSCCVLLAIVFRWVGERNRNEIDPVSIMGVFFIFPMSLWFQRLSGLQAESLQLDTILILSQSVLIWFLLPLFVCRKLGAKSKYSGNYFDGVRSVASSRWFQLVSACFAICHIFLYLMSNKLVAGLYLPLLHPETAFETHAESVPIIQIFTKTNFVFFVLAIIAWIGRKSYINFLIGSAVLLVPLSKLSRADVFFSVVVAVIFFWPYLFQSNARKKLLSSFVVAIVLLWGMAFLGDGRLNRFGEYDVSYADVIEYNSYSGPSDMFAWFYGFFPLSFENLNNAVLHYEQGRAGEKYHGLISFSPLFNSFFFVKNFVSGYDLPESYRELVGPVNSAVTVPTALGYFYFDFNVSLIWVPMAFYMGIFLFLYFHRNDGVSMRFAYAAIAATFCLSSFQAFMASPYIYQGILIYIIAIKIVPRILRK